MPERGRRVARHYRLSRPADEDFVQMYLQGYERFGPNQAEHYAAGMIATFEMLAQFPKLARERKEHRPPVRVHRYGAHVIVYRVEEDSGILILRIRYGREDWSSNPLK